MFWVLGFGVLGFRVLGLGGAAYLRPEAEGPGAVPKGEAALALADWLPPVMLGSSPLVHGTS